MKTLYTTLALVLAGALTAMPASAQDEQAEDTVFVELTTKTLVIVGEDGDRIRIRTEEGDEGAVTTWIEEGEDGRIVRRRLQNVIRPHESLAIVEKQMVAEELLESLRGSTGRLALELGSSSELAKKEAAARSLAMKIRLADGDEKEALTAELREALDEIFALKQESRQEKIQELREKLDEAQQELAERAELEEEIIERRLNELLGSRSKYDW